MFQLVSLKLCGGWRLWDTWVVIFLGRHWPGPGPPYVFLMMSCLMLLVCSPSGGFGSKVKAVGQIFLGMFSSPLISSPFVCWGYSILEAWIWWYVIRSSCNGALQWSTAQEFTFPAWHESGVSAVSPHLLVDHGHSDRYQWSAGKIATGNMFFIFFNLWNLGFPSLYFTLNHLKPIHWS